MTAFDPADLNRQFDATLRGNRVARWVLTGLIGVVVAGSIILLWLIVLAQQSQLHAASAQLRAASAALALDTAALGRAQQSACATARDLSPLGGLQSKALILLINDSRRTFVIRRCPGQLPPPASSFVFWARFYQVPVVR